MLDSADGKVNGKDADAMLFKTPEEGGVTVSFTGTATGSDCDYAYAWSFGDGGTSSEQNPQHTYKDPEPKKYDVTLTVTCKKCGTGAKTDTVKLTLFQLKLNAVAFDKSLDIYKDQVGKADLLVVNDAENNPAWRDDNLDGTADEKTEKNERIGYVRNTQVKVSAKFKIKPALDSPVDNVTIKAKGPDSLTFKTDGFTLSGSEAILPVTTSDQPLPNQTKFYNPMSIDWEASTDGTNYTKVGSSEHKAYVTLSEKGYDTGLIYLTTLHLAVSNDGATDKTQAFLKSWQFFSVKNVTTWEGRPLYYYYENQGFDTCATGIEGLLTSDTGSGACSAFGILLQEVLGVNGINTEGFFVFTNDASSFLVKNWDYGKTDYDIIGEKKDGCYQELKLSEGGIGMVPTFSDGKYGDMSSLKGISGQNTVTPSEKVFINHFIVKAYTPNVGGPYFDASYGVAYQNSYDFKNTSIDGFTKKGCQRKNKTTGNLEEYIGVRKSSDLGDMFEFPY